MNWPGFTAEAAIRGSQRQSYGEVFGHGGSRSGVEMSGSCTCSDPGCENPTCTCACPPPPDPCDRCLRLPNACARTRCFCTCEGGILRPSPRPPCFFNCFLQ